MRFSIQEHSSERHHRGFCDRTFLRASAVCQILTLVKSVECCGTERLGKWSELCLIPFPAGDAFGVNWLAYLFGARCSYRPFVLVELETCRFKIKPDVIQQAAP
jgi:hypothetical protein